PWTAWPRWSATWAELAQVTAPRAGFFLGPHWIETWIQIFGPQLQPRILVFHRDGGAAGICLIVSRLERGGRGRGRRDLSRVQQTALSARGQAGGGGGAGRLAGAGVLGRVRRLRV